MLAEPGAGLSRNRLLISDRDEPGSMDDEGLDAQGTGYRRRRLGQGCRRLQCGPDEHYPGAGPVKGCERDRFHRFPVLAAAIVFYAIYPMMIQALRRNQAAQDHLSGHLTATRTKIDKLEENLKRLGDGQRD
jgi:hypothetical protein